MDPSTATEALAVVRAARAWLVEWVEEGLQEVPSPAAPATPRKAASRVNPSTKVSSLAKGRSGCQ